MNCIAAIQSTGRGHRPTRDLGTRIGDAGRQWAADTLGLAFTQGYLAVDEYQTRLQQAFDATTAGAVERLLADLPTEALKRGDPRRRAARITAARRGVHLHLGIYLAAAILCVGIWTAIGLTAAAWYFWPIWPILGGGIGVIAHALPVQRWARAQRA
jgi:hypothetical protein